eukprot:g53945.t1
MSGDNFSDSNLAFNNEALLAAVTAADKAKSGSNGEGEKEKEKEEKEREKEEKEKKEQGKEKEKEKEEKEKEKEQEVEKEKEKEKKEKKEQEEEKEKEKEKEQEVEKEKEKEKEKEQETAPEEKEKEKKEQEEKEKEKKEQEEREKEKEKEQEEKEQEEKEQEEKEKEKENADDSMQLVVVARMPKGGLSYWVASGVTLAPGNQHRIMHAERCWRICKPKDCVSISEHKRYTEKSWKDDFLCGQEVCLHFKDKQKKSSGWRVARFDVQLQDTGKYNTLAVWLYHEADRKKFLAVPSIMSHIKCARAMDETESARAASLTD